jgi:hypothetical protein
MDIGLFQGKQLFFWLGQTCGRHAPSANGGTHQVNGLVAAWQPMAKQKSVYRSQNQALGTTCCTWHHTDVLGQQAFVGNVLAGRGASINAQGPHGLRFILSMPV